MFDRLRENWKEITGYERFEQIVLRVLLVFVSVVIADAMVLAGIEIIADIQLGRAFLHTEVMQDTFGSLLTVLILLEFNHSIVAAMRARTGAIQVRIVVLIAILVIARKLILLDYKSVHLDFLLGLGGLALALGGLYWLIADGDRRRAATGGRPSSPDQR